jgi:hypothetical protein
MRMDRRHGAAETRASLPCSFEAGSAIQPVVRSLAEKAIRNGIVIGMEVPTVGVSRNGILECAIGAAALAHPQAFDEASAGLA